MQTQPWKIYSQFYFKYEYETYFFMNLTLLFRQWEIGSDVDQGFYKNNIGRIHWDTWVPMTGFMSKYNA